MLQIDPWQLILAVAGLISAFATMVWLFGTILVRQFKSQLDQRFSTIQDDISQRAQEETDVARQIRNFEREFLLFQRDMPVQYVRREDYIRGQSVIEAKLDAIYSKFESVMMRGTRHD
jgi:hypothetical protein